MKALLVVGLWLFSAGALADPVPLFTAGPPIAADDPIHRVTEHMENFKKVHAIVLNPAAFGADTVTVDFNGKVHTFVMRKVLTYVSGPSGPRGNSLTVWEGEENDDSFDKRPDIMLRRWEKGELSGDFFLPPRSFFAFGRESPTRLIEMEADVGVQPGPFWLMWLRLAAILLIVGSALAVGTSFIWHREKSRQSTPSRLARADATIFGGTFLLFALIASCMDPGADWNPKHLDMLGVSGMLFFAAAGAGVVFWRVRSSYAAAVVSFWRAAREGLLGATVVFVLLSVAIWLIDTVRWGWQMPFKYGLYISTYLKSGLIFMLIGAAIGIVLWAINRYLLNRTIALPFRST